MNWPADSQSTTRPASNSQYINRVLPAVALMGSVVLCLAYARFRSQLSPWWASHGGGIPYVMFWTLIWFVVLPNRKWILPICIFCVLITCFLEFAQLWNPEPLATIRKTRFGAALLGSTFAWNDFPPYFIGGFLGYLVLWALSIVGAREQAKAG